MKNVEVVNFKLNEDDRGWVAWPMNEKLLKNGQLSNFHMPSLKPGKIRGNHYHLNRFEYVLILSGLCQALFIDNKTDEKLDILISDDTPKLFKIAPDTTHAFKNNGQNNIFILCYDKPGKGQQNKDVYQRIILS